MYDTKLTFTDELKPVDPPFVIYNQVHASRRYKKNRAQRGPKRVKDYLETLRKRAEETNEFFKKQNSPYTLEVRDSTEEIYLDLFLEDHKIFSRNVTEENFSRIIENITSGKGLIIDNNLERKSP